LKLLSAQPDTPVDETRSRRCGTTLAPIGSAPDFTKFSSIAGNACPGYPLVSRNRQTSLNRFCFFVSPCLLLLFCMQPMVQGWYVAYLDKSNGGAILELKLKTHYFIYIYKQTPLPGTSLASHGAVL